MKKVLLLIIVFSLTLLGCSKEQPEGEVSDVNPTVTQGVSIPMADSSEEKWHIYNEQEREEIEALEEKYLEYSYKIGFVLAYYEYYDTMETKLPVIINTTSENAEELYGGEWLEAESRLHLDDFVNLPDEWAYGVLTAKQVADLILGDEPKCVFITQDTSIHNTAESIDERTMEEVWGVDTSIQSLWILKIRQLGDVSLFQEGEGFGFRETAYGMGTTY